MHAPPLPSPRRRVRSLVALALLMLPLAACENGAGPSTPELAQIQLGDSLVVLPDADSARLKVTLLDQDGAPLERLPAGTVLRWTSKDTSIATVLGGLVQAWRPGETEISVQAGTLRASARVRVEPVPPAFTVLAGDGQAGGKGEALEKRLTVRVLDVHGRRVRDAEVEFAVTAGGGTFTPALQRTDSAGTASASWTLGAVLGEQKAEARLVGQPVAGLPFTARALRQIAFTSERDGNAEIYLMYEDGSGQRNLTSHPAADRAPEWSPDGQKIIFISEREGTSQRYSMNADGSGLTRLPSPPSPPVSDPSFRWSPDGTKGVFARVVDQRGEIHIVNADGSGLRSLTAASRGAAIEGEPAWSPDGGRIAFIRAGSGSQSPFFPQQLLVINVDGSGLRTLRSIDDHSTNLSSPEWSPDGKSIVYGTRWRAATPQLHMIDADGTNARSFSDAGAGSTGPVAWSPDGQLMIYTWIAGWSPYGGGSFPQYLIIARVARGTPPRLGSMDPSPCADEFSYACIRRDHSVRWSADGAKIVLVRVVTRDGAPSTSEIHVVTIGSSSGTSRVSTSPAKDHSPVWRP